MSNVELMVLHALIWYMMLLCIGIIFFPYAARVFSPLSDKGYGLSKAFGIALLSYAIYALGSFKLVPFHAVYLLLLLGMFGIGAWKLSPPRLSPRVRKLIFIEETLAAVVFFAWVYIRAHQPAIHGLEKFMDFGFINAALRGAYFPTQDMWLAGYPINYYYFGHITGAVLTKLSTIPSYISYNLIVAQLASLSVVGAFSFIFSLVRRGIRSTYRFATISALLGTWLVNAAGNLHTIYTLTTGYNGEKPVPFWELPLKYSLNDLMHPMQSMSRLVEGYWYPNATRFIPFTIHEFPIYSYVVADLHGHLFDIPFALISLSLIFVFFIHKEFKNRLATSAILGFFLSINLMTNAFDAPIYLGLALLVILSVSGWRKELFAYVGILVGAFMLTNIPFNMHFKPFATGVGFNCLSTTLSQTLQDFASRTPLGSHLVFEGVCQSSSWWMLITLWGFFWFTCIFFAIRVLTKKLHISRIDVFVLILCAYASLLIIAPEFVYAKDIYPTHFRANTMFKLGYAAFIMLGSTSAYIIATFKHSFTTSRLSRVFTVTLIPLLLLVSIYPAFAVLSYYGESTKTPPSLDGKEWLASSVRSEYLEIIDYLNNTVKGQPVILEAAGDSYTDYNIVSSYTGLPTVAGWYVHQWLWRGDNDIVGALQKDIQEIYTGTDVTTARQLIQKHNITYIIVGSLEREKFPELSKVKLEALGQAIFTSKNGAGTIYKIPVDSQ